MLSKLLRLFGRCKLLKYAFKNDWKKAESADVLLVCADADRSFSHRLQFYAPLMDSIGDLAESLGAKCLSCSDRVISRVGNKAYRSPLAMNRTLLWFASLRRMASILRLEPGRAMNYLNRKESRYWIGFIASAKPKLVIGIQPSDSLCLACHIQGVPIYDLQHGLISDTPDNPYYFNGRQLHSGKESLPTGFLCWDEESKLALQDIDHFVNKDIQVIGNPWFGRFLENDSKDLLVKSEEAKLRQLRADKPTVLVTLQYGLDEFAADYVSDGVMVEALREVIKSTANQYRWWLRLHPSQMVGATHRKLHSYLNNHFGHLGSVDWQECSSVPMPLVMSNANLHITHFSSAVIEAASFSIPSAIIDPHNNPTGRHWGFYRAQIDSGVAEIVEPNALEIKRFIERWVTPLRVAKSSAHSNAFIRNFLKKKLTKC